MISSVRNTTFFLQQSPTSKPYPKIVADRLKAIYAMSAALANLAL